MIALEERDRDRIRDTQLRTLYRPKGVCVGHILHSH
jgi:hypothetical protein